MTFIHAKEGVRVPRYESSGAAGFDIRANIDTLISIPSSKTVLIPTGLFPRMDPNGGIELQIRSRSGISYRKGLIVLNAPATIDPDYEGEIMVVLHNASDRMQVVEPGDRIAQGVFAKFVRPKHIAVAQVTRGIQGFGSTGVN